MRRIELESSSGSPVIERPRDSLVFRYAHVGWGFDESAVRKREEIGFRVLGRIATDLRLRGYGPSEASAPAKKRIGITRMKCGVEPNAFWLALWPPDGDDEWLLETMRVLHEGKTRKRLPACGLANWNEIRAILERGIAGIKGTSDLQWVSRIEHELARSRQKRIEKSESAERPWISGDEFD